MCKRDMQTVGLREGDEGDRAYWKETIDKSRRPQMTGKARGKEEEDGVCCDGLATCVREVVSSIPDRGNTYSRMSFSSDLETGTVSSSEHAFPSKF